MSSVNRDYSTISPSAGWLVKLKAFTQIPFAREAAQIMFPQEMNRDTSHFTLEERIAIVRWMIHFENRYWTVEKLLEETNPQRILEISSGYSFRGIDWCKRLPVHFIDTDLPELINIKTNIANQLIDDSAQSLTGKLEVLPLNAMDRESFMETMSRFSPGPVTIVNEGLLVYLGDEEKKQLCSTIHDVLKQHGGYWVTGDIYIKTTEKQPDAPFNEFSSEFRKMHRLDENRFDDLATAEQFFTDNGFNINKKLSLLPEKLSAASFLGDRKEAAIQKMQQSPSVRETWCLSVR